MHNLSKLLKFCASLALVNYLSKEIYTVFLDVLVFCSLSKNAHDLCVSWLAADAVNDGERKLALRQVLAEALILSVLLGAEVRIVIPYLEVKT